MRQHDKTAEAGAGSSSRRSDLMCAGTLGVTEEEEEAERVKFLVLHVAFGGQSSGGRGGAEGLGGLVLWNFLAVCREKKKTSQQKPSVEKHDGGTAGGAGRPAERRRRICWKRGRGLFMACSSQSTSSSVSSPHILHDGLRKQIAPRTKAERKGLRQERIRGNEENTR
eukprot:768741-Hanusia_phi.AAC.2